MRVFLVVLLMACGTKAKPESQGAGSASGSGAPSGSANQAKGGSSAGSATNDLANDDGTASGTPAGADPCDPVALKLPPNNKKLERFALGGDCAKSGTMIVQSASDAKTKLPCATNVDWAKEALVVTRHMLSPATIGIIAVDDGSTITFISQQRMPCPDDPRPMPIEQTYVFRLPGGGDRMFGEASCTIKTKCP